MKKHLSPAAARSGAAGVGFVEIMIVVLVCATLTGIAIPVVSGAMNGMKLNSTVSGIGAAIAQTRYRAVMTSEPYTLTITTPGNTYVVTNVTTNTADSSVPLPSQAVALNGGTNATYTYTFCPNGTVYGAGGSCPGNNSPPSLSATYEGLQTNIDVSSVGYVTTTVIH